jgi:hypothetical protein
MIEKSDLFTRIGMGGFLICIILFVSLSSYVYFNNSSSVEIRIQSDNEIKKEKDAVNEALKTELVIKNDSLSTYKARFKNSDSLHATQVKYYEKKIERIQYQNDSLNNILRNLKQSDIQPVHRN